MVMSKEEKIVSLILSLVGIVLVVDVFLEIFFNIGTKQNYLTVGYCIAFILLSIKSPKIIKKKYVIFPLYLMIFQTIYSLYDKYFSNLLC